MTNRTDELGHIISISRFTINHIAARGVAIVSWYTHACANGSNARALYAAAGVNLEATEKAAAMSTLRLLLIVDENVKKVVSVPDDIDVKRLRELAANTFCMNPEATGVKCYDKDFEEWVLIPDDFVPKNKERLQVIPVDKVNS